MLPLTNFFGPPHLLYLLAYSVALRALCLFRLGCAAKRMSSTNGALYSRLEAFAHYQKWHFQTYLIWEAGIFRQVQTHHGGLSCLEHLLCRMRI
jgi:hypothetical protein